MTNRRKIYPSFNLERAIYLARKIYENEPHNEMTREAAALHMGYSGMSGASIMAISTLKRYRLLDASGGHLKLSKDAVTILVDEYAKDQRERSEALLRCLKSADAFADIDSTFSGIPAQNTLVSYLVKRGMKPYEARKIAVVYRDSVQFVGQATQKGHDQIVSSSDNAGDSEMPASQAQPATEFTFPLSANESVTIIPRFSLSRSKWDRMIEILTAMRPEDSEDDE